MNKKLKIIIQTVIVVLILAFLLSGCSNKSNSGDQQKNENLFYLFFVAPYNPTSCMGNNGYIPNPGYPFDWKFWGFDSSQYPTILGGDSSIAISTLVPGYLGTAKRVAVTGNTMCDMASQIIAIQTVNPTYVMYGSMGGNDLLGGKSVSVVVQTGKELVDAVSLRFPLSTKLVFIGVHPSQVSAVNAVKDSLNTQISAYVTSKLGSRGCYYDPMPNFGVGVGQAAPANLMLDAVHYNATMSLSIKSSVQSTCSVSW